MANLIKRASDLVGSVLKAVGILRYINKVIEKKYQSELAAIEKRHREELRAEAAEIARQQKGRHQEMQDTWETINILDRGIDHFRNLLDEIDRNTSLMRQETDAASSNYERLLNIEKRVKAGWKLSRQLDSYVKAKRAFKVRNEDLNEYLKAFFQCFHPKHIRIHQELAADLYPVVMERSLIGPVMWNLYLNALEAMSGKGVLFLKTMNVTHEALKDLPEPPEPGDYVLWTVADTGVGMDKKTMDHAFDPFFTTKETGREAGLGLSIVHAIIKHHGGAITVSSESGVGTTFNIYLRAAREKKEAYSKVSERQPRNMVKTFIKSEFSSRAKDKQ